MHDFYILLFVFLFSTVLWIVNIPIIYAHTHTHSIKWNQNQSSHNSLLPYILWKSSDKYIQIYSKNKYLNIWFQVVDINPWFNNKSEPIRAQVCSFKDLDKKAE